jgi:curved DNA-binding protein CbpA
MNYYDLLGVKQDATNAEIESAFKKIAKKLHPDVNNNDPFFNNHMRLYLEVRDILIDSSKRAAYDRTINSKTNKSSNSDFSETRDSEKRKEREREENFKAEEERQRRAKAEKLRAEEERRKQAKAKQERAEYERTAKIDAINKVLTDCIYIIDRPKEDLDSVPNDNHINSNAIINNLKKVLTPEKIYLIHTFLLPEIIDALLNDILIILKRLSIARRNELSSELKLIFSISPVKSQQLINCLADDTESKQFLAILKYAGILLGIVLLLSICAPR